MNKLEINKGDKFSKLTVINEVDRMRLPSGQTNRAFLCKCDCGTIKTVRLVHLKRGRIASCGCIIKKRGGSPFASLAKIWRAIKYRTSESYFERHLYFDKGVSVCEEWINSWDLFRDWSLKNGYSKGLHIDRIDNSKGYSPNNCRWVTCKVNQNNKDNTFKVWYKNELQPISLLLESLGKKNHYYTILGRIKRGWLHELAIDTPIKSGNYKRNKKQEME